MPVIIKSTHQRPLRYSTIAVIVVFLVITASVAFGQNGASKRKEANQLSEKVGQLVDLSAKRSVLRFNGK